MSDETADRDERHLDPASQDARREIRVADVGRWLRRNAMIILLCAVVGGAVALIYAANLRSVVYRASAILAIVPPAFASELMPSALTVQGYQELLESDAVRAATAARLVEEGVLPEGAELRGGQVRSRIFVSQRREETLLAPMIRLEARSSSPERAAAIVNTWAEVFQERVNDLMFGTTSVTVQFIEDQYPKARDRLTSLEDTRLNVATTIDRRQADAVNRWIDEFARKRTETAQLVNAYEAETNDVISEFRAEHRLVTRREELDALTEALEAHYEERSQVEARLTAAEHELKQVSDRLAETEQVLVLKRSLDDDVVVSEALEAQGDRRCVGALKDLQLSYEMLNPAYNQLVLEVNRRSTKVAMLQPRAEDLDSLIRQKQERIEELERRLLRDESSLNRLRAERNSGLASLLERREAVEQAVETERDTELAAIDREQETRLIQLDRQIDQERALFDELADKYNEALLARGQERSETIRLAAPAVPPAAPLPQGSRRRSLVLGVLLGAIFGTAIAAFRSVLVTEGTAR